MYYSSYTAQSAVSGNVRDNDLGNPTISSTPAVAPMHGTLALQADGQFTYTPNTDRLGDDTFSYQGCNAAGDCGTAVVNITVGGPRPEPDNFTTIMNRPLTENVLLNDEGTGLQASETLVTVPISGTAVLQSDGTFTYTPDPDFTGSDKFTYQVCDSDNLCADEIVTILVKEIPDTANHTVVSGEWLLQIARCYGTTVQTIRQHNSIPYPDRIFPGQVLDIREIGSAGPYLGPPCIQSHTVAAGETITSIAEMYGITASELARVNGLYTYYYYGYGYYYYYYSYRPIFVGQKLVVPRPIPDYMQPRP